MEIVQATMEDFDGIVKLLKRYHIDYITPEDKVDTRHPFNDQIMKDEFDLIKKNYKDEIVDILPVKSADICAWGAIIKEAGYKELSWYKRDLDKFISECKTRKKVE